MHADAIHDVLYALHKARPISDDALSNNFERKCKPIANSLRWALGLCFMSIMLVLTEKWLGLRMERSRLRLGILLGGSDKAVILAVGAGAWTVWHNLLHGGSFVEQLLYWSLAAFIGASGLGGIFANASIATMAYQRDLLALAICQHTR